MQLYDIYYIGASDMDMDIPLPPPAPGMIAHNKNWDGAWLVVKDGEWVTVSKDEATRMLDAPKSRK